MSPGINKVILKSISTARVFLATSRVPSHQHPKARFQTRSHYLRDRLGSPEIQRTIASAYRGQADILGAKKTGIRAILLDRGDKHPEKEYPKISNLNHLEET